MALAVPIKGCYTSFLFPILQGYPEDMILRQYGAPPRYYLEVKEYMDKKLPNRRMERGYLVE